MQYYHQLKEMTLNCAVTLMKLVMCPEINIVGIKKKNKTKTKQLLELLCRSAVKAMYVTNPAYCFSGTCQEQG